ncbi:MAG: NAD-dependent isocitrate dehydrogenase, partial [Deltaproteobacteria bacterium]|nr:NAD-dependent isocitrate dehydrogenase [Deltaproteobacteria bacterium]
MGHKVTLVPGDGIGPEVIGAAVEVVERSGVQVHWDRVEAGAAVAARLGTAIPDEVLASIRKNRVALKGPIGTPIGTGFKSVNVTLRQTLDLYACLRPVRSLPGVSSRWTDVDLVVVRENTEGLYAGAGGFLRRGAPDEVAIQTSVNTRHGVERCVRYAFEYTRAH